MNLAGSIASSGRAMTANATARRHAPSKEAATPIMSAFAAMSWIGWGGAHEVVRHQRPLSQRFATLLRTLQRSDTDHLHARLPHSAHLLHSELCRLPRHDLGARNRRSRPARRLIP